MSAHTASLHTLLGKKTPTFLLILKMKILIGIRNCLGNVSRTSLKMRIFQSKKVASDNKHCQEIKPLLLVYTTDQKSSQELSTYGPQKYTAHQDRFVSILSLEFNDIFISNYMHLADAVTVEE